MQGIDAVVVNYKTAGDLDDFLASYREFGRPFDRATGLGSLTVMNVDAGPADVAVVAKYPEIVDDHIIISNRGYGYACNLGARLHSREAIAFFNADIEITAGSMELCYDTLLIDDGIGIVGPKQVNRQGQIVHAGIFGTQAAPRHRGWKERDRGQYEDVLDAVTVSGSAYFVKRECWNELMRCPLNPCGRGAFLETRHYYEETWCSYHAADHGWRAVYQGHAVMKHKWHAASPVGGWADKLARESQAVFREACDQHGIDRD